MSGLTEAEGLREEPEVLRSLLQVGVNLTAISDLPTMLGMILEEVRKLARAEAGSLYILQKGRLLLAAVQNDRLASMVISRMLVGKEFPVSSDSLAGYVACSGEVMNIRNTYALPPGTPFRINRESDANTGYRARSILGIPLRCPGGKCIGVLELFNRIDEDGKVRPFPDEKCGATLTLASMAAVTIHNALLQDDLRRANLDTIIRLSVAAEFRDNETAEHLRRISQTCALIAEKMGLKPEQVDVIRLASPMHDVGKIGIPERILLKPDELTAEEYDQVKQHSVRGERIVEPLTRLSFLRSGIRHHHERFDGTGYPDGLAGTDIPLVSRIIAVADTFDALATDRPYRPGFAPETAMSTILACSGTQLDPEAVKAFAK